MYAREIIGLLNKNVQGDKVAVGRIDLMKNFSFIEVKQEDLNRVLKGLKHGVTVKGRSLVCDVAAPAPEEEEERKKAAPSRKEKRSPSNSPKREKKKVSPREDSEGATHGKKYKKEDWMKFLHPDKPTKKSQQLKGEIPDFSEEGWARRKPKKK